MDRGVDRAAPVLPLGGAAALAVSLFLRWFEVRNGGPTYTAWEAFSKADVVLAIGAAAGVAAVALSFVTRQRWPYLGGAIAGTLAAALIMYLISRPPGTSVAAGAVTDYGAFVGLAGSLVLVVGAVWSGLVAPLLAPPAPPPPP
jgi:hypothetical protein